MGVVLADVNVLGTLTSTNDVFASSNARCVVSINMCVLILGDIGIPIIPYSLVDFDTRWF